jgi:hypothetical protein
MNLIVGLTGAAMATYAPGARAGHATGSNPGAAEDRIRRKLSTALVILFFMLRAQ